MLYHWKLISPTSAYKYLFNIMSNLINWNMDWNRYAMNFIRFYAYRINVKKNAKRWKLLPFDQYTSNRPNTRYWKTKKIEMDFQHLFRKRFILCSRYTIKKKKLLEKCVLFLQLWNAIKKNYWVRFFFPRGTRFFLRWQVKNKKKKRQFLLPTYNE